MLQRMKRQAKGLSTECRVRPARPGLERIVGSKSKPSEAGGLRTETILWSEMLGQHSRGDGGGREKVRLF